MWAGRGGSSPRMRGKRSWTVTSVGRSGLIPAYAEKTTPAWSGPFLPRAHPRVCGENLIDVDLLDSETGSSPRMRGKLRLVLDVGGPRRLIPAYAGKTVLDCDVGREIRAHPRVCGENNSGMVWTFSSSGSSPRMRGKLDRCRPARFRDGLIPAYAGKTGIAAARRFRRPAHPRVCGENLPVPRVEPVLIGSSPRMRGKPRNP